MCFLRLDSFRLKATAVNFETNGRDARATIFCRQDELSYEKIAKILDCSLSAAKSLIHRGAGDAQGEVETVFEDCFSEYGTNSSFKVSRSSGKTSGLILPENKLCRNSVAAQLNRSCVSENFESQTIVGHFSGLPCRNQNNVSPFTVIPHGNNPDS